MHNLKYDELKIQDYFTDENLSNNEKITIMRWRILCEDFGENYKGGRQSVLCPLCMGHKDGQLESFTRCDFITHRIRIRGQYEEIFNEFIPTMTVKTVSRITDLRKKYIEN